MKIQLSSIFVDNQDKALRFYTEILGFIKKQEIPMGTVKWLTVVSAEEPDGTQLVLEPDINPIAKTYQQALYAQRIPATGFGVTDIEKEFERLQKLDVMFITAPVRSGPVTQAVLDDTCGNFIQLYQIHI